MNDDKLRVGVITSAHGIHGEVNVFPTTDDPKRFKKLKKLYIDTKKQLLEREIEEVKFFKNMVILKFKDHDDRNEAEKYRNCDLLIDREDAVPLGRDEYFICDVIGLEVRTDEGEKLGTVADILQTAANDVYVVKNEEGREYMIPSTPECLLSVDLETGVVTVHILPGLLDL